MVLPLGVEVVSAILSQVPAAQSELFMPGLWAAVGIPAVHFLSAFVAFLGVWRGRRRIERAVLAANGRACINCVHDLNGLGDAGVCPECGHAFDATADQRRWERVNMGS
jgi:hypothetical protein